MEKLKVGINRFSVIVSELLRRLKETTRQRSFALVVNSEDIDVVQAILNNSGISKVQIETPDSRLGKRYKCSEGQVVVTFNTTRDNYHAIKHQLFELGLVTQRTNPSAEL